MMGSDLQVPLAVSSIHHLSVDVALLLSHERELGRRLVAKVNDSVQLLEKSSDF